MKQLISIVILILSCFIGQKLMADTPRLGYANAEQFAQAQASGHVIIDIRREDEWLSTGIIEGAQTITAFTETGQLHSEFLDHFSKAVPSNETPFFIYCRSGQRTGSLGTALVTQLGYTKATHLSDGIISWLSNGFKTVPYTP